MKDKSNTFQDSGKGTFSSLDLSICHPSLYFDFDWSTWKKWSFPIVIENIQTHEEEHNPKLKLDKANLDLFHILCDESLSTTTLSTSSL